MSEPGAAGRLTARPALAAAHAATIKPLLSAAGSLTARPMLVVSIGVFREGRVLLIERAKPPAKGLFTFPGGRLECGETLEAAALRELREETAIVAAIAGFAGHVEMIERAGDGSIAFHAVIVAFAGRWVSGEPHCNDEVANWRYVAPADLPSLPTTPELARVVARAAELVAA